MDEFSTEPKNPSPFDDWQDMLSSVPPLDAQSQQSSALERYRKRRFGCKRTAGTKSKALTASAISGRRRPVGRSKLLKMLDYRMRVDKRLRRKIRLILMCR